MILDNFSFEGCGVVERIDFEPFSLSESIVVLKGLIWDKFYIGRMW